MLLLLFAIGGYSD